MREVILFVCGEFRHNKSQRTHSFIVGVHKQQRKTRSQSTSRQTLAPHRLGTNPTRKEAHSSGIESGISGAQCVFFFRVLGLCVRFIARIVVCVYY